MIVIDAVAGTLDGRTERRRAGRGAAQRMEAARRHDYQSGALWRYAQTVGDAEKGAVTHPGGKAEKHQFADI